MRVRMARGREEAEEERIRLSPSDSAVGFWEKTAFTRSSTLTFEGVRALR